ncbi:hypothetical protein B0H65DRAFT_523270 [Neurospora tetraspora]|uniref:HMG box domain-containing protein n=1 Tax=Neurospora tetraspora TaxID=94610 RepID=A0AAE0MTA3_9PEZI|nr:hypothetical protein B0H65DRAFT_523270 [Neurospora tetraspora]
MGRNKTCVPNPILELLLTKPFSEHTDLDHVPFRDMEAYVHRSIDIRHKELGLGKPRRPCNHFVLYFTATHARAEAWREAHVTDLPEASSHQFLSTIISRSWSLEPPSVKAKFTALAEKEKQMHGKAFPDYKLVRKPPRNRRKQVKSTAALPSTTDAKQMETKVAVAPQPLPSYNIQDPFPSSKLSPHIIQRLATLSGRAKELETFLKLCQTSELIRNALWPTDHGLDYQMAIYEYNAFVASTYDKLENHVRDKELLKPYVPKVFDLQWVYDEVSGMYKVSLFWPSMDLSVPASVSTPMSMSMPMDIDQQLPLGGCENGFTAPADFGVGPLFTDEEIEKALQEFDAAGANTADSEPVVNEPPAQVEQVPLPAFTTTEGLNDSDFDMMDFINFESEMPL